LNADDLERVVAAGDAAPPMPDRTLRLARLARGLRRTPAAATTAFARPGNQGSTMSRAFRRGRRCKPAGPLSIRDGEVAARTGSAAYRQRQPEVVIAMTR